MAYSTVNIENHYDYYINDERSDTDNALEEFRDYSDFYISDGESDTDTASEDESTEEASRMTNNSMSEKFIQLDKDENKRDRSCAFKVDKLWDVEQRLENYFSSMSIIDDISDERSDEEDLKILKEDYSSEEENFESLSQCEYLSVDEMLFVSENEEDTDEVSPVVRKIGKRPKERNNTSNNRKNNNNIINFSIAYVKVDKVGASSAEYQSDSEIDDDNVIPQKRFALE